MKRTPKRRERKDRADLESIESLTQSRAWKLFVARVALMKSKAQAALEADEAEIETAKLRARIRTITEVLTIPAILASEARKDIAITRDMED